MIENIEPLIIWIQNNPTWAGFSVFAISLSESLVGVGLVVPGLAMMTAIGALIGSGILPLASTMLWAILGAIAGDGISYWVGYHYHNKLRAWWPFNRFPRLLERGERFFRDHGGMSVVLGRFIGPIRPIIPVIAGMMDMTPWRFLIFNIISAIVWAPIYCLPGILIGASLGALSKADASKFGLFVLLAVLGAWGIYLLTTMLVYKVLAAINLLLDKIWLRWSSCGNSKVRQLLTVKGEKTGQLGLIVVFVPAVAIFLLLLGKALFSWNIFTETNELINQVSKALYNEKLIDYSLWFTALAEPKVILPVAFLTGIYLIYRRYFWAGFYWLGAIGVGDGIGIMAKHIIEHPRPIKEVSSLLANSFPSGHTLSTTLIFGMATYFLHYTIKPDVRRFLWKFFIYLITLMAFSRLYLGVHWFSDVIASLALGLSVTSLAMLLYRYLHNIMPPVDIWWKSLLLLCVAAITFNIYNFHRLKEELRPVWPTKTLIIKEWLNGEYMGELLYRNGAIKPYATAFDIQWLANEEELGQLVNSLGFKALPGLRFNSMVSYLSSNPTPFTLPAVPKFHHDRLPLLVFAKDIGQGERELLQLWVSDHKLDDKHQLLLGTLRKENLISPLPFVNIYKENKEEKVDLVKFKQALLNNNKKIIIKNDEQILIIMQL